MVDSVEAPDPTTVVFRLKFATNTFLPSLADPFAFIYLEGDPRQGSALVRAARDGLRPVQVRQPMTSASRSRANGIPTTITRECPISTASSASSPTSRWCGSRRSTPAARRWSSAACRLRRSMTFSGNLATRSRCRPSDWNCGNVITPNQKRKPFDDVRVRRALLLAVDQWHGAPALSKIANVRTVGGIVFPGSPLAATKEELQKLAGFWPDIEKSRAEARRLLKEAGQEGLQFGAAQPERRSAIQVRRHLAGRSVEQDRREGDAARAADRPVAAGDAHRRLRRRGRGQLQQRGQSRAGHAQIPAAREVSGELRRLQRSGTDRSLRAGCCARPTSTSSGR